MQEISLAPGHTVYSYTISSPCFLQLNGESTIAEELFVEVDPYQDHEFAMQIITKCNQVATYHARDYDTWPPVARRLFRRHVAVRRSLDV